MMALATHRRAACAVVLAGLLASTALRRDLLDRRKELRLDPPRVEAAATEGVDELLAARGWILTSAGLGVFRAVLIDYLWLRALSLKSEGSYFEVSTISALVTRLQARIPTVWAFAADNLAYNISYLFPPAERYPWVLEGLRLLSGPALAHNPGSIEVCSKLAFVFHHKIGGDTDTAAALYRDELARAFGQGDGLDRSPGLLKVWGMEAGLLRELEEEVGVPLDLRIAAAHAFYWAERGRRRADSTAPAWMLHDAMREALRALLDLFAQGRLLRADEGPGLAFLPDLRFEAAVSRAVDPGASSYLSAVSLPEDLRISVERMRVAYVLLAAGEEEAAARLEALRRSIPQPSRELPEIVVEALFPGLSDDSQRVAALTAALEARGLLLAYGEQRLAAGFLLLAGWVHADLAARGAAPGPLDELARRVCLRRLDAWRATAGSLDRWPAARRLAEAIGGVDAGSSPLSLPWLPVLPLHIEALDPLFGRAAAPGEAPGGER